ncbi:hypothetical protein ACLBXJ_22405 [Methylobacterium mesophilicum]
MADEGAGEPIEPPDQEYGVGFVRAKRATRPTVIVLVSDGCTVEGTSGQNIDAGTIEL